MLKTQITNNSITIEDTVSGQTLCLEEADLDAWLEALKEAKAEKAKAKQNAFLAANLTLDL